MFQEVCKANERGSVTGSRPSTGITVILCLTKSVLILKRVITPVVCGFAGLLKTEGVHAQKFTCELHGS